MGGGLSGTFFPRAGQGICWSGGQAGLSRPGVWIEQAYQQQDSGES
ncbi:hypothetical protein ACNKHM_26840 [Shigella sonnei]